VPSSFSSCPYCQSRDVVKRGRRKTKYEVRQLFLCTHCGKTFTPQKVKGHSFPLKVILDGLSFYNTGLTLEESCALLKERFGLVVAPSTLADWVKEFAPLCRYARMREFGLKLFSPSQAIQSVRLYHRQVFDFRYHRAKLALILQDFRHKDFEPLREFLDAVAVECPHQWFTEGPRASEAKPTFDLAQVLIREKSNFANRLADLVLQAVPDNKLRHETLQRFMLANDSVTVACEVPVYLDAMDLEHMREELGFQIPLELTTPAGIGARRPGSTSAPPLTGHVDLVQLRNGAVHLLDYKPRADKERPVAQLTLYALALSRLTGLRLFHMKCAWFDEQRYFEFFPLHVVLKKGRRRVTDDPAQLKWFGPAADVAPPLRAGAGAEIADHMGSGQQ